MLKYLILSSGSCGNSYAFYDGRSTILVDMGLTRSGYIKRMEAHEIPTESVKALFITHLHPDHAKGIKPFLRAETAPLYISDISKECNSDLIKKMGIDSCSINTFKMNESIQIDDFTITAFRTYHDSAGSAGFYIKNGSAGVFLMTDTGQIPFAAHEFASASDLLFIETNYDPNMLKCGPYSKKLQARITGGFGHLSNEEGVLFAKKNAKRKAHVYFIHVSENNNDVEIIQSLAREEIESGIFVTVCERGQSYCGEIER